MHGVGAPLALTSPPATIITVISVADVERLQHRSRLRCSGVVTVVCDSEEGEDVSP
jgi:hypothetical protein